MASSLPPVGFRFRILATVTAILTFLLIVVGGIVRVSGSGLGCPDWPLCHGQIVPPFEFHTLIEYSHRLLTTLVTVCLLSTALVAARNYRARVWIVRAALLAVVLLLAQIVLGGITVLLELPPTVIAAHLANSMLLLASVLTTATLAWRQDMRVIEKRAVEEAAVRSTARVVLSSAAAIFILIISGAVVTGSGASSACPGWPFCSAAILEPGMLPLIHMLHRFIAGGAGLLALYTFYRVATRYVSDRAMVVSAQFGGLALIAQIFVGAANVWLQFPPLLAGLHLALAAATWGALVIIIILLRRPRADILNTTEKPAGQKSVRATVADYVALTKR